MTYVDDIESDLSRFHRLDLWAVSFHRVMRLAGKLPAYQGALALAMQRDEQPAHAMAALSPAYAQPVDPVVADNGDTPPDVVAQLWQNAIVADYQSKGFQVDGIEEITPDEMRAMLDG